MPNAIVGLCTIKLHLPGTSSLKAKRSLIKPLLKRLHNTFNVSAAEIDNHDIWQSATIAIVMVGNSTTHANQVIHSTLDWIETHYPDLFIVDQEIEIL
jgi:uncharacterized protein